MKQQATLSLGLLLSIATMFTSCDKDGPANVITPSIAERSKAIINSFQNGDTMAAHRYVNGTVYIQHNLQGADGRASLVYGVRAASAGGTKVSIKRTMTDGNMVFLHTEYLNIFGQNMAAFDVYRYDENGFAVEHWDNLQSLTPANGSGHLLLDGSTTVADRDKTEANRTLIKNYIREVFISHNFSRLASYVAVNLIQHNPAGRDSLSFLQQSTPFIAAVTYSPKKYLAEGNFVLVMSEVTGFPKPTAVYDLFRIEDGKIAEHWDIIQEIQPSSEWANTNGKW